MRIQTLLCKEYANEMAAVLYLLYLVLEIFIALKRCVVRRSSVSYDMQSTSLEYAVNVACICIPSEFGGIARTPVHNIYLGYHKSV